MIKLKIPSPINVIQEEIIQEFKDLQEREEVLTYLMEIGEQQPVIADFYKAPHNIVEGCAAKVWLTHHHFAQQKGRLFFEADSDAAITKGLISLLLRVLSGQRIEDIVESTLHFVKEIKLLTHIGQQRGSGFGRMLKKMKLIAIEQSAEQLA